MLKVAVTGGIGSGKSVVCHVFETLGAPVYYADDRAKQLMAADKTIIAPLRELLGEAAYVKGVINKEYVAGKIFSDPSLLKAINAIVHPAVFDDFDKWCTLEYDCGASYVIMESAIVIDIGARKRFDKIITVTAPEQLRLKRIMDRNNVSEALARKRISSQAEEQKLVDAADYVLHNDETELLLPQIIALVKQLT